MAKLAKQLIKRKNANLMRDEKDIGELTQKFVNELSRSAVKAQAVKYINSEGNFVSINAEKEHTTIK